MATDGKATRPEREQTDESLRTERANADRSLRDRKSVVEHDEDAVLVRARGNADDVLVVARERADQQLEQSADGAAARDAVAQERSVEDRGIREERAAADASLQRERRENAAILSRLLPMERQRTDRYLLTERARSDEDLLKRDDFLGIVSHDLRNLLGGIVLSADLLAEQAQERGDAQQTLAETSRMQRYAARMNRLIGDLVDVVSIDAGKLGVKPTAGNVSDLVDEAVGTFQAAAVAAGIVLSRDASASPVAATFDHDRMFQVLANLIANALKFTASGGVISLHAERVDDLVRVAVSDTGSGIPADMVEAVFERFWQVGSNDRRGLGLGLYISRCIVEAHGGRIWVESKEGQGSTFCFEFGDAVASHAAAVSPSGAAGE